MGKLDGVLKRQYEVHCRRCERAVLGLGGDLHAAQRELVRSYGFRCIKGKWFCAKCAVDAAREPTDA